MPRGGLVARPSLVGGTSAGIRSPGGARGLEAVGHAPISSSARFELLKHSSPTKLNRGLSSLICNSKISPNWMMR
jgi:hypothetical protein